jgi:hypothetical protein
MRALAEPCTHPLEQRPRAQIRAPAGRARLVRFGLERAVSNAATARHNGHHAPGLELIADGGRAQDVLLDRCRRNLDE